MRRFFTMCLAAAICSQAFISIAGNDAPDSLRNSIRQDTVKASRVSSEMGRPPLSSMTEMNNRTDAPEESGLAGKKARQRRKQMKAAQFPPEGQKGQVEQESIETSASDANNPLASIKSVSIHDIYTPSLYNAEGMTNVSWKRYSQPIGRVLIRASLPVNTVAGTGKSISGLGDFNIFATYIVTKPTARNQFGLGPILTCPTATNPVLGAGKWQAGLALVAYFVPSPEYQIGALVTWQHSFAGNKNRKKAHAASFQPMNIWQIGKGAYLRSTGIIVLDFENGNYWIPFGLGAGKVFKAGKLTFNIFAEPQYTVWHKGAGIPQVQIFVGVNTQF